MQFIPIGDQAETSIFTVSERSENAAFERVPKRAASYGGRRSGAGERLGYNSEASFNGGRLPNGFAPGPPTDTAYTFRSTASAAGWRNGSIARQPWRFEVALGTFNPLFPTAFILVKWHQFARPMNLFEVGLM